MIRCAAKLRQAEQGIEMIGVDKHFDEGFLRALEDAGVAIVTPSFTRSARFSGSRYRRPRRFRLFTCPLANRLEARPTIPERRRGRFVMSENNVVARGQSPLAAQPRLSNAVPRSSMLVPSLASLAGSLAEEVSVDAERDCLRMRPEAFDE